MWFNSVESSASEASAFDATPIYAGLREELGFVPAVSAGADDVADAASDGAEDDLGE